ncbi:hypothetical protein [Paenibacillus sp. 481]|uniref:hypothetical protein n=1 Tax=Paenibacillus sp. 481 TaxID=2835869 RepID=UPI001E655D78|nr:hypothetical protein [Paenibacillus sp. 481]UHA74141.1 hypothetical protein KIK04_03085 [Paenibacillus sp. 481]
MFRGKRITRTLLTLLITSIIITIIPGAMRAQPTIPFLGSEQPSPEELKLLQQSLSLTELDKEIERIGQRERGASDKKRTTEQQLIEHEQLAAKQRERAGRVLRSYYIGERDMLLQAMLSAKQWQDMLALFDYFHLFFESDHKVLQAYNNQMKHLKELKVTHEKSERELNSVRSQLVAQRDRVASLQRQFDKDLASSGNPEAMSKLIDEFTVYWKSVGLYEVRYYFRAMASAMHNLPQFIKKEGNMSIDGFNYTVRIKDEQLNEFLRQENEIFKPFAFRFEDDLIVAEGERDGLRVLIAGNYTIETEPQNVIRFHVQRLKFNGLELPQSTIQDLEDQFDLGFYPQQLVSFIVAKEVTVDKGEITVKLTTNL